MLAVIALVITGFAVNFDGLSSSEVEVSDGGVWVLNEGGGLLGRLNVDAQELDARLSMTGDDLDVLQSGYNVIETGSRGMTPINAASVRRGGLVELPPGSEVALGGDRVAIAAPDGRVWILTPGEAAAFSTAGVEPAHTSGSMPQIAVSTEGTVFVLDDTELHVFPVTADTRDTEADQTIEVGGLSTTDEMVELTTVGEEPVILDRENRMLRLGTEVKDYQLTEHGVSDLDGARLQQSSSQSEDVVLATADALFVIPLDGGQAREHPAGGTGTPTAPAQAQGCAYGAWNGSKRYVRACGDGEPTAEAIPESPDDGDLRLRVNNDLVVLNDQEFGLSWMITDAMQIVDDWVIDNEIQTSDAEEEEKETLTTTITNIAAERDEENRPPVANDDEFGVRPGKSVVLPVVRNDTDPDGDLLTVSVEGDQPDIGTVTPIQGGTQLQIDVDEDASGTASFTYRADDGRAGQDTATVTLEVRGDDENEPPQPAEQAITKMQVRSGEEVSLNILPYWEDPDGDAFYLADATVEPEDIVSFRADGLITFDDAGLTTGTKQVQLTFRDEHGQTGEGVLEIEAVTDSDLEPITTADHASIVAGRSTTINPLANDINPNGGQLELTHVSEAEGLTVDAALEAGTINLTGDAPGTYYLDYTVAASGASTASDGLIRVDVIEPDSENLVPVAVDDMGTVTTGSETLIDPLENDVDPTGGVLVVNSVSVPEDSGLKATVVGHHLIKVEAEPNAEVGEEPVALTYEVANSEGSSTGTLRMMVAQTDTQFANPVAVPDEAVVRAGDMVLVDVLANDISPTGAALNLGKDLTIDEGTDELGHVEPHQDQVRFTANDDASGEAVVTYEVVDETGRTGSARLTLTIVPRDAPNTPPRPENLTARTVAGSPVRIPVPTTGIDPDGDSVMLTGIASPTPELGEVTKATGEWIEYVPHEDSVGTDRFRYQVMDRNGAVGMGEVLVGVAQPNAVNQPPHAVDDTVEVRPDREVQIPVLENDTDPEGAPLHVVREDVEAMTEIEVDDSEDQIDGVVTVQTPSESGTHTVLYSASDGQLKDSATVTIKVDENAPLRAPIARDDFVEAADVLDPEAEHIDVDVLANDSDPDGSISDLEVTLDDPPDGTEVRDDKTVRVTPQDEQQRIRYIIEDADELTSAGYIWVPGRAKQAPVWVGDPVEVQAGAETTIDLADPNNVRVRPGAQQASVTDPDLVSAAHTDGTEIVQDATTLLYRAAEGSSGQDTISVEVTDGEVGDETSATATLAIPVRIAPEEENLPPTLQGAVFEIEQGGAQGSVDLAASAEDPEGDELTFSLGEFPEDPEVNIALEGSTVTAQASARAAKGTIIDVPVSVSDGTNDPVAATVQVTVGSSNRPLISTGLDEAEIDAGDTGSIPVLDNDSNPFPGGDRRVFAPSITSGDGDIGLDGDEVVITPAPDFNGTLTAQYMVEDDTQDPDRHVSGEIQVTVRGLPDAPSAPRIGEVGDGFVELNFRAGDDNGAPITGYTVTTASGPKVEQECSSTSCTITGLQNDTEYSFQVVAHNDVGDSDPSAASPTARPDVRPEAPSAPSVERGDTRLTASWEAPVNRGSAIEKYDLQIQNTSSGQIELAEIPAGSTEHVWDGLDNGVDYRFRVRAHNLAEEPSDWSGWSQSEHPAGPPGKPGGKMEASRVNDPKGGGVEVTWPEMTSEEANGEPIHSYIVTASDGGGRATVTAESGQNSHTFYDLDPDTEYTFSYLGVNSVGEGTEASDPSNTVTPWAVPTPPTEVSASMPSEGEGEGPDGRATISWSGASGNGTTIKDYVVRWDGGSKVVSGTSLDVTGLTNGKAYTFTVQARNRFKGGESAMSEASNSITPYTKPSKPQIKSSSSECTDGTTCPVSFTISADGSDGGGGGKTLQYRTDGGSWKDASNAPYTHTENLDSGASVKMEARVVNGEGLTSSVTKASETAEKWLSTPALDGDLDWGGEVPEGTKGCTNNNCRYFQFSLKDMTPGETYTVALSNEGERHYKTFPMTADQNGRATTEPNDNFYSYVRGGEPEWPMSIEVEVNGKYQTIADDIFVPN